MTGFGGSDFSHLLQRGQHAIELRVYGGAETLNGDDDGQGNAAGEDGVLDRGGAGSVIAEAMKQSRHDQPLATHAISSLRARSLGIRKDGCSKLS